LAVLVDQSLVGRADEPPGESRYTMLETIREYALEQLETSGEEAAVRATHAAHFLWLAERVWPASTGTERDAWLKRQRPERDNFRAALAWTLAHDPVAAVRLVGALDPFWYRYGDLAEGRRWIARALATDAEVPVAARALAVRAAGWLAYQQGDLVEAEAKIGEAAGLFWALGDDRALSDTLLGQGNVALSAGDLVRARECFLASRAHALAASEPAQAAYDVALDLGRVATGLGDLQEAQAFLEEALANARAGGGTWDIAVSLYFLGEVHLAQDDLIRALASYREGLVRFAEIEDLAGVARCLEGIAGVATEDGQFQTGAKTLGAAASLRERIGHPGHAEDRPRLDRSLSAVRAGLGEAAFAAAWEEGRASGYEQAVTEAGVLTVPPSPDPTVAPGRTTDTTHGLTPRELAVLGLLAEGRSDREIAEALFVSRHTAANHVANILAKLGVPSRAAAAAYAVRHGLA
jgi:DNA-binding CsgD family transcriptional regulator